MYLWENAQNTSLLYPNSDGVRLVDSEPTTQPHNSKIMNDVFKRQKGRKLINKSAGH